MAIRWEIFPRVFHSIVIIVLIGFSCVHSIQFKREHFVFWSNGTIPFYVNTTHFDKEQTLAILSTLSDFAHKTCLQFRPVVAGIHPGYHVLSFENQDGVRRCVIAMEGHAKENPHRLTVGYSCLRSPHLQMLIMKALGFPFEHNRMGRDLYIDVQFENIQPGFRAFYTKEKILPEELRDLPYDINSVMHFGERDYSKNGHRSFFIKNHKTKQSRTGLSKLDIIKIDLIYGPECKKRDRQAKIDICKEYPTARRKRETELDLDRVQNLRINRDITPPPEKNLTEEITDTLKQLNIDEKVQDLIEQVHKMTAAALENERVKLCNHTNVKTRKSDNNTVPETQYNKSKYDDNIISNDITKIIEVVINYVKEVVNNAKTDLNVFCNTTNNIELFQRARCGWGTNNRCPLGYKSTKSGAIRYSTKYRPYIRQSTKHERASKPPYVNLFRSGSDTEDAINATREKRDVEITNDKDNISNDKINTIDRLSIAANNTRNIDLNRNKRESNILNNKDLNNGPKIRKKREADTIILLDDINNGTEKINESPATKTDNEVTESLVKIDATANNDINVNGSKDSLRMATKVFTDKKGDFAPARRNNRDDQDFSHSRNEESDRGDKSGESTSSERHKIKQRTTKRKRTRDRDERREREEERPRKRDRNIDEDRPQNKRVKSKRGRQRPRTPETVPLTTGNKEFYAERIWPNGVVRYVITPDSTYNLQSVRARLAEVNDILKKKTCVRIEEISERKGQGHKDYLVIDASPDYVTGRVGGKQNFGSIELFEGGQHRQHAAMMVMAMLGFYFESARHDRDQYVRVHNRHIRPDKLHHFEKIRPEAKLNLPYDYESATHPAWQFWRRVGRSGISSVATYKDQDPDGSIMKSLGQNEQLLSNLDIIKINSVYGVHCFSQRPS